MSRFTHCQPAITLCLATGWLTAIALFLSALGLRTYSLGAAPPPPDLRLEWRLAEAYSRKAPPISGIAGSTVTLRYRLRNVGGSNAFAAVIASHTALGRQGRSIRLRPGPKAGRAFERTLDLPLAVGIREICIEARLQTIGANEPRDPHPEDNTLCRRITVHKTPDSEPRIAGAHARRGEKP